MGVGDLPGLEKAIGRLVVIVDDDSAVRESTSLLLEHAGHRVIAFESGTALIEAGVPHGTDVILLDMMMPGLSGLDTLRLLRKDDSRPPVVVITGHGDIPLAVDAMKLGAVEFLEKPYPVASLLEMVATLDQTAGSSSPQRREARGKVEALTARQREVLKGVALGEASKVTAHRLGLSIRTVEAYRSQIFARLGARGAAEAVRIAVQGGLLEA